MPILNNSNYRISSSSYIFFGVVFLILAISGVCPALAEEDINQKILDLRGQIEILTKQAELYKKNIGQKQKEVSTLSREIDILNNQILKLQTNISITGRQIDTAKLEITYYESKIFGTQAKINTQKKTIGKLVVSLYERDKISLAAVLINNARLSDFAALTHQEQNLNQKLNLLLIDLKKQQEQLKIDKAELESKKHGLEVLNDKQITQRVDVEENKLVKNKLLVSSQGKEKEFQRLLSDVERKKTEFFAELQKLETEAIERGAFIVHVKADFLPPKGTKLFKWPEEDYYLTQGYGSTAFSRRGIYGGAPHNGIDIASGLGSSIYPVASGNVLASGFNTGWGNWVAIRHVGGLVSVYAHMRSPTGLSNNTPVTTNSIIGYEGSTGNSTGSHLHLSVYKDFFTYINPKNGQLYFNYFEGSLNPLDYL